MKVKILAALTLIALASPMTVGAQATTYTYTGPTFSQITDTPGTPGTYTTAMRVSGSMSFMAPLSSGLSYAFVLPETFSFSDGRVTITEKNAEALGTGDTFIRISTNNVGTIIAWAIQFRIADPTPYQLSEIQTFYDAPSSYFDDAELSSDFITADQATADIFTGSPPGSWAVTAVPEPETYAMLIAGLGLLAPAARRVRMKVFG